MSDFERILQDILQTNEKPPRPDFSFPFFQPSHSDFDFLLNSSQKLTYIPAQPYKGMPFVRKLNGEQVNALEILIKSANLYN